MSKNNRPLPPPPKTPFERKRTFKNAEEKSSLLADEMAMAFAEGKLEDFIGREIPDNKHARKLVEMMMGMTGLTRSEMTPVNESSQEQKHPPGTESASLQDDIMQAVMSGKMDEVINLLKREHTTRNAAVKHTHEKEEKKDPPDEFSSQERELLGTLKEIADENDVSVDWLVMRAIRVYIEDHRRTGRL